MTEEYEYFEFIDLFSKGRRFDVSAISEVIAKIAPCSFQSGPPMDSWVLCRSEAEKLEAERFVRASHGKELPASCPTLNLSAEKIEVSAGYRETNNFRVQRILQDVTEEYQPLVFDEYGRELAQDFSRYPNMKIVAGKT